MFGTLTLLARNRGPDKYWRKRKVFKLVSHLRGRRRNCYTSAIKGLFRSLMFATRGRKFKRMQLNDLWNQRLEAACQQHGISWKIMNEGLIRNQILLNRKVLVDLAIWEPRSFQSLAKIAWARACVDGFNALKDLETRPKGIITRGMLK